MESGARAHAAPPPQTSQPAPVTHSPPTSPDRPRRRVRRSERSDGSVAVTYRVISGPDCTSVAEALLKLIELLLVCNDIKRLGIKEKGCFIPELSLRELCHRDIEFYM